MSYTPPTTIGSSPSSKSSSSAFTSHIDSFTTSGKDFSETQTAGFAELEWAPFYWLALRPGLRVENSALLNQTGIAPRMSLAIKTGNYSQVSLATGIFYQDADNMYLLYGYRPDFQQAIHYIANWQWVKDNRTLRLEAYYKNYQNLVVQHTPYTPNSYIPDTGKVDNSGYGYAKGIELFWRDKKSVKNLDYWISYSYIDTRRLYKNYITEATPTFIANHNLNLIGKYFIDKWQTNISVTYSFATGMPYYDPNYAADPSHFLQDKSPSYNNLAITLAYLHTFGKWFTVFYLGVDNVTDYHNVFGYRYPYNYSTGAYGTPMPVVPALYRSIFFGVNMSLTKFTKDEL